MENIVCRNIGQTLSRSSKTQCQITFNERTLFKGETGKGWNVPGKIWSELQEAQSKKGRFLTF